MAGRKRVRFADAPIFFQNLPFARVWNPLAIGGLRKNTSVKGATVSRAIARVDRGKISGRTSGKSRRSNRRNSDARKETREGNQNGKYSKEKSNASKRKDQKEKERKRTEKAKAAKGKVSKANNASNENADGDAKREARVKDTIVRRGRREKEDGEQPSETTKGRSTKASKRKPKDEAAGAKPVQVPDHVERDASEEENAKAIEPSDRRASNRSCKCPLTTEPRRVASGKHSRRHSSRLKRVQCSMIRYVGEDMRDLVEALDARLLYRAYKSMRKAMGRNVRKGLRKKLIEERNVGRDSVVIKFLKTQGSKDWDLHRGSGDRTEVVKILLRRARARGVL